MNHYCFMDFIYCTFQDPTRMKEKNLVSSRSSLTEEELSLNGDETSDSKSIEEIDSCDFEEDNLIDTDEQGDADFRLFSRNQDEDSDIQPSNNFDEEEDSYSRPSSRSQQKLNSNSRPSSRSQTKTNSDSRPSSRNRENSNFKNGTRTKQRHFLSHKLKSLKSMSPRLYSEIMVEPALQVCFTI